MKLLRHYQLSAAGLQAQALGKLPPVAAPVTPPQPAAAAVKEVTETASPSYWPKHQAWADKLWEPVLMPWEKAQMEGGRP